MTTLNDNDFKKPVTTVQKIAEIEALKKQIAADSAAKIAALDADSKRSSLALRPLGLSLDARRAQIATITRFEMYLERFERSAAEDDQRFDEAIRHEPMGGICVTREEKDGETIVHTSQQPATFGNVDEQQFYAVYETYPHLEHAHRNVERVKVRLVAARKRLVELNAECVRLANEVNAPDLLPAELKPAA